MRTKNCTHCGETTHAQPQDSDHDTGYGHCYDCLNKGNWYVHTSLELFPNYQLDIWTSRPFNSAPLTTDDSDPKVCEIKHNGKVVLHQTYHKTTSAIVEAFKAKLIPQAISA